jgi:integrase
VAIDIRTGVHTADSTSITVAEAARLWLAGGEAAGLERTTLVSYRQHVDLHLVPFIGLTRLSMVTVPLVRHLEDRLRGAGRSPAIVQKVIRSLGSILADAMERGLVAQNVVRSLRSRRHRGKEARADRRQKGRLKAGVDIPTPDEMRAIIGKLEGRRRPLLLTAIFGGLRASELRGLRWADLDLHQGDLHVRQLPQERARPGLPQARRTCRNPCQHRAAGMEAGADRGRRHRPARPGKVPRPARASPFLRQLVRRAMATLHRGSLEVRREADLRHGGEWLQARFRGEDLQAA